MAIQREYNTIYEYLDTVFSEMQHAPQTAYEEFKNIIPIQIPINKEGICKIIKFISDNSFTSSKYSNMTISFKPNNFIIDYFDGVGCGFICTDYQNPNSIKIYANCYDGSIIKVEDDERYIRMLIQSLADILSFNYNLRLLKRRFNHE